MQARREVRRLADDAALLRLARSNEVADDHQAGGDPDAHAQRRAAHGDEFGRGLDDCEAGLHGALGVVFVGLRVTEIGEHTFAHIFADETAAALDPIRAAAMVGAEILRMSSGSSLADMAVEPTRSQKITVSWRRSAASAAGGGTDGLASPNAFSAPSRLAIALRMRLRGPSGRPIFSRSVSVKSGKTSASISLSRNAASYRSNPSPRSQAAMSILAPQPGLGDVAQ